MSETHSEYHPYTPPFTDSDYITVTKVAADNLIATNGLSEGEIYKITGCHPTLYNDGTNSGTTVIVQALSNNTLSKEGYGIFYNPKYNSGILNYNIWSNIITSTSTEPTVILGNGNTITANTAETATLVGGYSFLKIFYTSATTWSTATSMTYGVGGSNISATTMLSHNTNDKTIFGGYVWSNVAGAVGSATNIFTLSAAWTKVAYNITDYNLVYDKIIYNYANDTIIGRKDTLGNEVEYEFVDLTYFNTTKSLLGNPINVFGWGNPNINRNIVKNSYCENLNNAGESNANKLYGQSIIAGNIVRSDCGITYNTLNYRSEIRNNTLLEVCYIYDNQLNQSSTITSNVIYNNANINSNSLTGTSTINSNEVRRALIIRNLMNYSSTINSNISKINTGHIYGNIMSLSTINSNTYINNYTQGSGSDRSYINTNQMVQGKIDSNTLTVTFNGRGVYIANNTLIGDYNADIPIRYSVIQSCAISSSSTLNHTYLQSNTLRIGQILNANINTRNNITDNVIDDYIYDFSSVQSNATLKGILAKADKIEGSFSVTFTGAANYGLVGTVYIPQIQAPIGYYIHEVLVDVGTGLTAGAGAIINLGISTDATTAALNNTTGLVTTLNAAGVTKITAPAFTKSIGARNIVMSVTTANITAGTIGIFLKLAKLV